jgi:uncharacterized DUF497 family protein
MDFEWDETKRLKVLAARGVDFVAMVSLFDGRPTLTSASDGYDELRNVTIAERHGKLFAVVWTMRGEKIRIITARRARHEEERHYRQLFYG